MVVIFNYLIYKWWEIDDKIKRLYIELLVEKFFSFRKILGSRKVLNGKDIGVRQILFFKYSFELDIYIFDVIDMYVYVEGVLVKNNKEKQDEDNKFGKYIFEIIIIDIFVKYDYIKSLKKRVVFTVLISFFEQSNKFNNNLKLGIGDNKDKNVEKLFDRILKGQFFFKFQKLSLVEKEIKFYDEEN